MTSQEKSWAAGGFRKGIRCRTVRRSLASDRQSVAILQRCQLNRGTFAAVHSLFASIEIVTTSSDETVD
jgi:hypothetical protein